MKRVVAHKSELSGLGLGGATVLETGTFTDFLSPV